MTLPLTSATGLATLVCLQTGRIIELEAQLEVVSAQKRETERTLAEVVTEKWPNQLGLR